MRRRLNAGDRWVRCQPPVSDSEASHLANECEQVWREMSTKIAPRRYFTTGDIADYIGLTREQITKTASDPNSWLALFVMGAGKGKHGTFRIIGLEKGEPGRRYDGYALTGRVAVQLKKFATKD